MSQQIKLGFWNSGTWGVKLWHPRGYTASVSLEIILRKFLKSEDVREISRFGHNNVNWSKIHQESK